jgi:hypothetical protein
LVLGIGDPTLSKYRSLAHTELGAEIIFINIATNLWSTQSVYP